MDLWTFLRSRIENRWNERLSRQAFKARQLAKFRRLVRYVQKHSPYYAAIIRERGIAVDTARPEDFPVQTKSMVMQNFDMLVTDRSITRQSVIDFVTSSKNHLDLFRGKYLVIHSSGSSGETGYFLYSTRDFARCLAPAFRANERFRLRKQQCAIGYVGASGGHFALLTMVTALQHTFLRSCFPTVVIDINDPIDKIVDQLNDAQPDLLISYGSMLTILAEKQLAGDLSIHPRRVRNGAEPATAQCRAVVLRAFGVDIQNGYGSTEHLIMGYGLPEYDGMYLMEDELYFECKADHTLVTNMGNYTQPLIRYRMEDVLIPVEDTGGLLPFTKIADVVGRVEHTPVFRNKYGKEDYISPSFLVDLAIENLRRYQFQILGPTAFVFRFEPVAKLSSSQKDVLVSRVKAWLDDLLKRKEMENLHYDIVEVDNIPLESKSGKFKLILPPKSTGVEHPLESLTGA